MSPRDALNGRMRSVQQVFGRPRSIGLFARFAAYIERLSAGDRYIVYGLGALIGIVCLISAYSLEQTLLVPVPAYGGSLTEGEIGNPQFINPLLAITDTDNDLTALTYAGLMGVGGNGKLEPVLAKGYTVSNSGKTYTFTLRQNAEFSNGTPVTAADVVYTVQKAQDAALKSPVYANWSGISVKALDARTVQFTLPKPYAPFLDLTTLGILPEQLWQNVLDQEFPFSNLETKPVGAGPFVVSSLSRNSAGLITSMTLTANPHYVLGRPYLNQLHFVFYAQQSQLQNALRSGAVQSAYGIPSPNALKAPYARVFAVFFNGNNNKAFTDTAVRKALSLGINRRAIAQQVLGGYATPIMGPVPPGGPVTQVPIATSTDPTATAAQILESNGWSYDGSARDWKNAKTGDTLGSITIRTSNVPELKNVALAVKNDWQRLGIAVTVELYEPGDLTQNVIRPRDFGALLYGEVIGRSNDLYAFWDSQEQNDPGLNIAQYANKNVDSLLEDARTSTSTTQRAQDLQKIENTIASDYPAAFIYSPDFTYTIPSNLHGVELPQITAPADRFATVAKWYVRTDHVWPFFAHTKLF